MCFRTLVFQVTITLRSTSAAAVDVELCIFSSIWPVKVLPQALRHLGVCEVARPICPMDLVDVLPSKRAMSQKLKSGQFPHLVPATICRGCCCGALNCPTVNGAPWSDSNTFTLPQYIFWNHYVNAQLFQQRWTENMFLGWQSTQL